MAKLMSKKTKEIVKTTTVIVLVVLVVVFYAIYPLIIVPDMVARPDIDDFDDPEFSRQNDATIFFDSGLNPDTVTFITNDNVKLAALYFQPDSSIFASIKGTVIMLHPDDTDRTAIISYIAPLLDSGLAVIAYDQRACGLSGGKYHFAGDYEADDLVDIIAYLNMHEMLIQPIITVGFELGADAAISAARDENRISATLAIDPYLSSSRWLSSRKDKKEAFSIPLHGMIYFWWFQKHTGYPFDRTFADDMLPINNKTTIIISDSGIEAEEIIKLKEISDSKIVSIITKSNDTSELQTNIFENILSYVNTSKDTADSL